MSTIVTRSGKGSPLSHVEVDANFTNLNTDKIQSGNTVAALTITSATINGGAVNATTIGASTASTGAFTSLTDSGNLTFTGTGNRITGDFSNATTANRLAFQTSTTNGNSILYVIPNGTATTGQWVVTNSSDLSGTSTGNFTFIQSNATDGRIGATRLSASGSFVPLAFYTSNTEAMRIDTSGNVGIGTSSTGSARLNVNGGTSNSQIRFEVSNAAFTQEVSTNAAANAYVYKSNDASYHVWKLSSSTAMTLNTSGNLGIGTSSPDSSNKLQVAGDIGVSWATNEFIGMKFDSGSSYKMGLMLNDATRECKVWSQSSDSDDKITFYTGSTPSERMRITTAGDVGIGTSSPSVRLHASTSSAEIARFESTGSVGYIRVKNSTVESLLLSDVTNSLVKIGSISNTPVVFNVNDTERMRIDSSGNLLLNTTSLNSGKANIVASGASQPCMIWDDSDATSASQGIVSIRRNGSAVGLISTTNTNTTYATSSDYRLKENIVPMTGALATIAALKPVTYKWKSTGEDSQGFIAHELAEVVPDCVSGEKDAVNEDGSIKAQSIDTSFLVATLTAAIQEQQALITNLTTRLNALEGK
jgi:hypothetical protein